MAEIRRLKSTAASLWAAHQEILAILIILVLGVLGYFAMPHELSFLNQVVSIALLVLSLGLVTGYSGVATLGQAALFGISAYAAANACRAGLTDPLAMLAVGALAGTVSGLVFGALIVRFRGLPQLVLSIAIGQLVAALANKLSWLTGGSDGLAGFYPSALLGMFEFDLFGRTGYALSVVLLAIVMAALLRFVRSPFGLMCRAMKDNTTRVHMIGVFSYPRLVIMFGISGAVAGLGGALMAVNTGVIGLDSVSFELSAEALVMLVLGGASSLWGALAGAVIFQFFEHTVSSVSPYHWMSIVGLLLILVVIFAPRGLGFEIASRWKQYRSGATQK